MNEQVTLFFTWTCEQLFCFCAAHVTWRKVWRYLSRHNRNCTWDVEPKRKNSSITCHTAWSRPRQVMIRLKHSDDWWLAPAARHSLIHTACGATQAGNPSIDDGVQLQQSWWSTRVLQGLRVLHACIFMTSQQLWNQFLWFKLFLTLTWQTTLMLCPQWL